MPTDALITMILAMILLWGGLAASIAYAVKVGRATKRRAAEDEAAGRRAGGGSHSAS